MRPIKMITKRIKQYSLTSNREFKPVPERAEGLARLDSFSIINLTAYADERNYDYGVENRSNVSVLSPWVRRRLISEEEIIESLLITHS